MNRMSVLTRVFVYGFFAWCVLGAIFRLFVMTIRSQPYDAVPLITIFLVVVGFIIIRVDKETPHE